MTFVLQDCLKKDWADCFSLCKFESCWLFWFHKKGSSDVCSAELSRKLILNCWEKLLTKEKLNFICLLVYGIRVGIIILVTHFSQVTELECGLKVNLTQHHSKFILLTFGCTIPSKCYWSSRVFER